MEFDHSKYSEYYITRRRYIPDELISLKGDKIHLVSEDLILSSWKTIRKKEAFSGGISALYPKEGWKISKIFDHEGGLYHWYCDIMETKMDGFHIETTDMLLDIVVENDGSVCVLDCDELAEVLEKKAVSQEFATTALRRMDKLLRIIYHGRFNTLTAPVEELDHYLKNL